jgi:hypothetical protein
MKTKLYQSITPGMFIVVLAILIAACSKDGVKDKDFILKENVVTSEAQVQNPAAGKRAEAAQNKLLADIRKATAKYQNIEAAFADGYEVGSGCVSVEGLGGMGYHIVNFDLFGADFDPLQPQALLYEPNDDGDMNLVGVEYVIFSELWDLENDELPMLGIVPFEDHTVVVPGEGLPFPNYQLHVWIWKGNPLGMYFPFNPNVICP